jgi:Leucine-rich repeat (LRR) protein
MELRLRLLNFQNNAIRSIQNLENLPNLIFLDLYVSVLSVYQSRLRPCILSIYLLHHMTWV